MLETIESDRPVVLATIIRQTGPAPRERGTKCLIMEDGSLIETIGGGQLEARTLQAAKEVFATRLPHELQFVLKGRDVAETDMLCGGEVSVFLEPVLPGDERLLVFLRQFKELLDKGESGILATVLDKSAWEKEPVRKVFLSSGGAVIAGAGLVWLEDLLRQKAAEILESKQPCILLLKDDSGVERRVYVEPVVSAAVAYVFGGGHVSRQIVPLAALVGFRVEVIDDRPEFCRPDDFPDAEALHQLSFEKVTSSLSVDGFSYLVIVTRGHIHDKTVLSQALRTKARYVGMIGSRRKKEIVFKALLAEGFTREDLARVYSPIGLDIGAQTPAEIAVSIVAEMIAVRAGKLDPIS